MDEQLKNFGKNIIEFWKKLSKKIKIAVIVSSIVLIAGAIVLTVIMNKTDYVVLFSKLEDTEVTEVMAKLQEKNVEYKYEKNGQILVPEKSEALLRMQLAQEGYPQSGANYDIFKDNVNFMTTDSEKKTYFLFLRQERLQASIKTIDGVHDVIVTLSIPENNNFAWDVNKEEPTASVKINMMNGQTLSRSQIQGVKRLIQTSVSGLKDENLAIIDTEGNDLLARIDDSDEYQTNVFKLKLDIQSQIEKDIESSIKKHLLKMYGEDNYEVSVRCKVNLDKKISELLKYIPDKESNKGVINEEDRNVEIVGNGEAQGGVVGTETNSEIPVYPDVTINGDDIYYKNNNSIKYLVSQLKEQVQSDPGSIEDVKVAVLINRDRISEEDTEKIKALIGNAAGTLAENVAIHNMKFGSDEEPPATEVDVTPVNPPLTLEQKILYGSIAGGVLLLFIIILIIILRANKKKRLKREAELLVTAQATARGEDTWADLKEEIGVKETKEMVLKKQIAEFANNNPEIASQLIKTWIKGEDN